MHKLILPIVVSVMPAFANAQELTAVEPTANNGLEMSFSTNLSGAKIYQRGENGEYILDRTLLTEVAEINALPDDEGTLSPAALEQHDAFKTIAREVTLWEWSGSLVFTEDGPAFLTFLSDFRECAIEYTLDGEKQIAFAKISKNSRKKLEDTAHFPSVKSGDLASIQVSAVCSTRKLNRYSKDGFSFEVLYPNSNTRFLVTEFQN